MPGHRFYKNLEVLNDDDNPFGPSLKRVHSINMREKNWVKVRLRAIQNDWTFAKALDAILTEYFTELPAKEPCGCPGIESIQWKLWALPDKSDLTALDDLERKALHQLELVRNAKDQATTRQKS